METLYFAEDIAQRYHVSVRKAKELLKELPAIKVGAKAAVRESALAEWEENRQKVEAAPTQRRGRKPRGKGPVILDMTEMRCPTRRELRELAK